MIAPFPFRNWELLSEAVPISWSTALALLSAGKKPNDTKTISGMENFRILPTIGSLLTGVTGYLMQHDDKSIQTLFLRKLYREIPVAFNTYGTMGSIARSDLLGQCCGIGTSRIWPNSCVAIAPGSFIITLQGLSPLSSSRPRDRRLEVRGKRAKVSGEYFCIPLLRQITLRGPRCSSKREDAPGE